MDAAWLSIKVELIGGRGQRFWPRPGRLMAASVSHTFAAFATALDDAFARWDRSHLHAFELSEGRRIVGPFDLWDETRDMADSAKTKLSALKPGEQFGYLFDFGDDWTHLCSVASDRVDPVALLGATPRCPTPYLGWGDIPDQYGRRLERDDGDGSLPTDPRGNDLPKFLSHWAWS